MAKFNFTVTVECESKEEAETVIGDRLGYDEDYGFDYSIYHTYKGMNNGD